MPTGNEVKAPDVLAGTCRTLVMGIVNVTPDSFSDGGRFLDPGRAIEQAWRLIDEGADILDIGGESTRPTHTQVSADEEWRRLEPVLHELCGRVPVPVSVDTYKADTAIRALGAGANIINDVWGGLADPDILRVVAEARCPYIWMHNRHEPAADKAYETLVAETLAGIEQCLQAGIADDKLWLDPGIGFGKTYTQNLAVLKRLPDYCNLGYKVLLGTSRKSVIGYTLDVPPGDRLEGSLATVAIGIQAGVRCVRVHDVLATVRTARMVEAVLGVEE